MSRTFLILLGFVAFYVIMFLGAIWGTQIYAGAISYLPKEVVTVASIACNFVVMIAPAVLSGALAGFCLSLYRGGKMKPVAIICGAISFFLVLISAISEPMLTTASFAILATLLGIRLSKRLKRDHWFCKLLGDYSDEEKDEILRMKRNIDYLHRSKNDIADELALIKAEKLCSTLPGQLEEHKAILLKSETVYAKEKLFFDSAKEACVSKDDDTPDHLLDWEKHLTSMFVSLSGARSNLSSAQHVVSVVLSLNKRGRNRTAVTTANIAKAEMKDMVGNLQFVTPYRKDASRVK